MAEFITYVATCEWEKILATILTFAFVWIMEERVWCRDE